MSYTINKKTVEALLEGYWFNAPQDNWYSDCVAIQYSTATERQNLLVAIDQETWLKGTSNTGVYAQWEDTHLTAHKYSHKFNGVIAKHPIEGLPAHIPQFITSNTFDFINEFSSFVRPEITSKVISVTGTVGKTSTKEYLAKILRYYGSVHSTNSNHNSRTGVKLTVCNAMHNPDYLVVESALTALYMKSGSCSQLTRPNIAIITEIGVGQGGFDEYKTAEFKSRIADGLSEDGYIILNRDIRVFDELRIYCERYSKNILTYGEHPDADIKILATRQNLHLEIEKKIYEFKLPTITDQGTLHNLSAAIATAYIMNLDINKILHIFEDLNNKKSVLEILKAKQRPIEVIDDTYNAEHLSMLNAFKFCMQNYPKQRKVLIVGDIINLKDKSIEIHQNLAEPILESQFDLIATFGNFTQYLHDLLPKSKLIGHFTDAENCVEALLPHLKDDDVILVKGSRRNSTIHNIPALIVKCIDVASTLVIHDFKYRLCFDKDQNSKKLDQQTQYGIGGLILVWLALKNIALRQINLDQHYIVSENVGREGQRAHNLGLVEGEQYTCYEILQLVLQTQSADVTLALAEILYGSTNQALQEIKKEAELIGINSKNILNVTGRILRNKTQYKSLREMQAVINQIKNLPKSILALLQVSYIPFKGKVIQPKELFRKSQNKYYTIVVGQFDQKNYLVFDHNYLGIFHYNQENLIKEYDIPYVMEYGHDMVFCAKKKQLKTPYINILGDSYFGEFYTRIRKKRGIDDALQKFGYGHSFEKLAHFFRSDDMNMVNLEASFTSDRFSALKLIKPYILDADAQLTLQELQRRNIHYLNLANNHAKDFGDSSLAYTLQCLNNAGMEYIGAGLTQKEALAHFEVSYGGQSYAIFNGYWHRERAYSEFEFYALGDQSGVSSLTGLLKPIQAYKKLNPDHKVIVIAHWGVDFQDVQPAQQNIAIKLIEHGTDLIIGHGAHTLQPIRKSGSKAVIYSLGNGVFNSNGEFERYKALPYGLLLRLDLANKKILLYPFVANNKETFWQPHPVNEVQFEEIYQYLMTAKNHYPLKKAKDVDGFYLELEVFA